MSNGQPWRLRGVDVFTVRDEKVAAKLAYVKGSYRDLTVAIFRQPLILWYPRGWPSTSLVERVSNKYGSE